MNSRRVISSLLTVIILFSVAPVYAGQGEIIIVINNKVQSYRGTTINGRTLVPLRDIFESLGAQVGWYEDSKTIIATKGQTEISMILGSKTAKRNGEVITLDEPAICINGSTYVPLRFVGEAFDSLVAWDGKTETVSITYTEPSIKTGKVISGEKAIYTQEYLQKLVNTTEVDEDIYKFRAKPNSRRNGLEKVEGKYFDMYYPSDQKGREVADFLKPHMDKVYMMLTDIYGVQAEVEVHLIHEKDALHLKEGDIRAREKVTFVWIEPNNDDGGNNLSEFVHEINHNFFQKVNGNGTNEMWINEANAKLIPSLYIEDAYDGPVDMWSFDEMESMSRGLMETTKDRGKYMTLSEVSRYLSQERSWSYTNDSEKKLPQYMGIYFWCYIFNNSDLDTYKYYLRNMGNGDVIKRMEELLGKDESTITEELIADIKERSSLR